MQTVNLKDFNLRTLSTMVDGLFDFLKEEENTGFYRPVCSKENGKLSLQYDIPGANKDQIEVSYEDNIIIVKGIEGRYKGCISKIAINREYEMSSIDASLKDGVLNVAINPGKKPTNKIPIR